MNENITFDISKLKTSERKVYELMSDYEKSNFERMWLSIESQKNKLKQQQNAAKLRAAREQKEAAEKARKIRTKRLIERGAMIEGFIEECDEMTNDEFAQLLKDIFNTYDVRLIMKELKEKQEARAQEAQGDNE